MNMRITRVVFAGILIACSAFCQAPAPQGSSSQPSGRRGTRAGNGTISGTVKDDTGGVIPGATITVSTEKGVVQTVQSGADGTYTLRGLPPGSYSVSANYSGLQQEGATAITLTPGQVATGNITMTLQVQKQEVTVTDTAANSVSTDPANNAGALVLRQEDLDALPDDPDDLEADLQALPGLRQAPEEIRSSSTDSRGADYHRKNPSVRSASTRILFRRNSTRWALAVFRCSPSPDQTS